MFPFLKKEDKNYEVFTKSKLVDKTLHRINQRGFLIQYMRGINKHIKYYLRGKINLGGRKLKKNVSLN